MTIGIDASRAFLKNRTGIEEYSYQVIKHLRDVLPSDARVVLYVRKKLRWHFPLERQKNFLSTGLRPSEPSSSMSTSLLLDKPRDHTRSVSSVPQKFFWLETQTIDFDLPKNWTVRALWAPRFWTQVRLSLEMLLHPVDVLFIPAHTVPVIHPRQTVVTMHGLEYEFSPASYSWYERFYMRFSIRHSIRWAKTIIAVSENTKRDLMRLYGVPEEKIRVVYEGVNDNFKFQISNFKINPNDQNSKSNSLGSYSTFNFQDTKFFLFIGRVEERKNVARIVEAFESFKQKTGLPHKLLLAGKPGYGYEKIKYQISKSKYQNEIQELGYVTEEEKWGLLKNAEALLFPSLYEGFGLPILEAQQAGTPVITSTTASLPEIAGEGALLVDPVKTEALAEAMAKLATDPVLRADIIDKAAHNVNRFSWATCAREVASLL